MSFPPATPMSFARILTPRPGYTYDRVTYPNLPQFAETITFDRYTGNGTPCGPFAQCSPEYAQYCDRLRTSRLGGLGMLTVPVAGFVRAAANGLGGLMGLGETYEERAARERARIAHETAMRNAAAATPSGPRAPLPPGTTKTPMQAAADAVGNFFGAGSGTPATPPGTTTDAGEDLTTSATPPINTSGAPNWGLYVGLSVAAVAAVALIAVLTKKPSVANRRRNRRRNAGGGRWLGTKHEWTVDAGHEDIRLHGKDASVYRYGQLTTTFRPTESQLRKIRAKHGKIHVTTNQIETARIMSSSYGR